MTCFAACEDSKERRLPPPIDSGVVLPDAGMLPPDASGAAADSSLIDTGLDSGPDAEVPLMPDFYVDPVAGEDTRDGTTPATAFKTLCTASYKAKANQTIALLDGTYGASQRPPGWINSLPCGPSFTVPIRLIAMTPGNAVVGVTLTLAQGGEVRGIKLDGDKGRIHVTGGALVIRDLSFGNVFSHPSQQSATINVTGTAKVAIFPGAVTNYATVPVPNDWGLKFAFVHHGGELTMEGGTIDDSAPANNNPSCTPLFEVTAGTLTLKNFTARHKGTIARVTSGTFDVIGGTLEGRSTVFGVGCAPAILVDAGPSAKVTMAGTTLPGGAPFGIAAYSRVELSLTGVTLSGFTEAGIDLGGTTSALTMRNCTVQANKSGIRFGGTVTADIAASTISGNTICGLRSESTAVVMAAGNVWTASQQEAGADGKYATSLRTGLAQGPNYCLPTAANKIQF